MVSRRHHTFIYIIVLNSGQTETQTVIGPNYINTALHLRETRVFTLVVTFLCVASTPRWALTTTVVSDS